MAPNISISGEGSTCPRKKYMYFHTKEGAVGVAVLPPGRDAGVEMRRSSSVVWFLHGASRSNRIVPKTARCRFTINLPHVPIKAVVLH